MNELIRKLTQEVKEKMTEVLAKSETKSVIDATKAASDSGNFEVVISTADIDRQGESINQAGWDLVNYKKNPVVLWGHDYYSLPIGICDDIQIADGKLVARGRFAPEEANPFAQQVRRLYDAGIVRATSVGLIVLEMEGHIVSKAELLEFSFVPVPANPYALSLSQVQKLGLNLEMIAIKGLKLEVKEAKAEGDECEMPDGSMGEMHPNDSGEMVCTPKAAKASTKPEICEPDSPNYDPEACSAIFCNPESDQYDQEACDLMKAAAAKRADEKLIADYYAKSEHKEKDAQQIGAILAQLQNIIDNAVVTAAKLILDIIQTEYGQSAAGKEAIAEALKDSETIKAIKTAIGDLEKKLGILEGEEQPQGGAAPQERSEDAEVEKTLKGLDDYLAVKGLLKSISTFANESLGRLYEKERAEREARKR